MPVATPDAIGEVDAAIANLLALRARLLAGVRPKVEFIDQYACEPLSSLCYLDHGRRGDFPIKKVGRRVLCRREDFDAFLSTSRRLPTPVTVVEDDVVADLELAAARIARRAGRRR